MKFAVTMDLGDLFVIVIALIAFNSKYSYIFVAFIDSTSKYLLSASVCVAFTLSIN